MTDFLFMVGGALFAMFVSGIVNYGKREWVGLTDEEKYELADDVARRGIPVFEAIRQAEAKLKEKNT